MNNAPVDKIKRMIARSNSRESDSVDVETAGELLNISKYKIWQMQKDGSGPKFSRCGTMSGLTMDFYKLSDLLEYAKKANDEK